MERREMCVTWSFINTNKVPCPTATIWKVEMDFDRLIQIHFCEGINEDSGERVETTY